jgi:ferredoxin-NADP reductase
MNEYRLQLQIDSVRKETADTVTFFLREVSGRKVHYKPGQFITLIMMHHGEEIRRSYSLSSSPDEDLMSITVKRIQNGEISRLLLTYAKPGDIWDTVIPAGRFTPSNFEEAKDVFYFAAGSGITPVFSHLKYLFKRPGKSKVTLIYSNLNEDAIIFKQPLDDLSATHPDRLTVIYLLSSNASRLNNLMAEQLVRRYVKFKTEQAEFFLCGPFTYMRMVNLTLLYMGIEPAQIRKENFVLETVPIVSSITNFPPQKVVINFHNEAYSIIAGENQSILQAGLQNNIQLPYSCRGGVCSSCAAICKSGKVEMVKNEVLTDAEIAAGWVLTCTGHALTDNVVIEFPTISRG